MTIEERATQLRKALEEFTGEQLCGTYFYPQLEAILADALRAAVAAEREACSPSSAQE